MRSLMVALAATAGLAVGSSALGAETLYGVGGFGPFSVQTLYTVDPVTGFATAVGSTGIDEINGLAFDRSTATMYAYTTDAELYTIDLSSGAATLVADATGIFPEGDIAIGPGGGAFVNQVDEIGSLSLGSAAYTPVGPAGVGLDLSGLVFGSGGALFGYATNGGLDDSIVTINPLDGSATALGLTGFNSASGVGALAFDASEGLLYLTDGSSLYGVNSATGAASFIGAHGAGGFSGLAFIPAPGSVALLALGGLAGLRRRR